MQSAKHRLGGHKATQDEFTQIAQQCKQVSHVYTYLSLTVGGSVSDFNVTVAVALATPSALTAAPPAADFAAAVELASWAADTAAAAVVAAAPAASAAFKTVSATVFAMPAA